MIVSATIGIIATFWTCYLYLTGQDWKFMAFVALLNNQAYMIQLVRSMT